MTNDETNILDEIGWDGEIEKDGGFTELPEGDYDFSIDHYERSRENATDKDPACNAAIVHFNILCADGSAVSVRDTFKLLKKYEWKLSALFRSVGLKKEGEKIRLDWDALPGLTGRCHIKPTAGKKNPDMKFNNISKLYPKEPKQFTPGNF